MMRNTNQQWLNGPVHYDIHGLLFDGLWRNVGRDMVSGKTSVRAGSRIL
jgi:hypothetical protein